MNKKTVKKTVVVRREWIEGAVVCHPGGGCAFHLNNGGSPQPVCGCCQLARAYFGMPILRKKG